MKKTFLDLPWWARITTAAATIGAAVALVNWTDDAIVALASDTFPTKAEVNASVLRIEREVQEITAAVRRNTEVLTETNDSVLGLQLSLLDIKIEDVEEEIAYLEGKQDSGRWDDHDESSLRRKQKQLRDLDVQRTRLFEMMIDRSANGHVDPRETPP